MRGMPGMRNQTRPQLPEGARDAILQSVPYYSRGILYVAKDGGNNYVFPVQELRLFGYGLADPMTPAMSVGAPARNAAEADTNVERKSETNAAEDFTIYGLGVTVNPNSDGELVRQLGNELSFKLQFGTQQAQLIGPLFHLPGGGGWQGTHRQDVSAANSTISTATNGWPEFQNIALFPEGIVWARTGSGPDSQLSVIAKLCNAVTVAGVVASPASLRLDFHVRLFGRGIRRRGRNQ